MQFSKLLIFYLFIGFLNLYAYLMDSNFEHHNLPRVSWGQLIWTHIYDKSALNYLFILYERFYRSKEKSFSFQLIPSIQFGIIFCIMANTHDSTYKLHCIEMELGEAYLYNLVTWILNRYHVLAEQSHLMH